MNVSKDILRELRAYRRLLNMAWKHEADALTAMQLARFTNRLNAVLRPLERREKKS